MDKGYKGCVAGKFGSVSNDHASSRSFTYRHLTLYMQVVQLMRLGDASAEAYDRLTELFRNDLVVMLPNNEKRDSVDLEDMPEAGKDVTVDAGNSCRLVMVAMHHQKPVDSPGLRCF